MSLTVKIEPLGMHQDTRGWLYEPLNAEQLKAYHNVHVVLTLPGAIRGNHAHRLGTEVTTLVGPALVRYRIHDAVHDVQVPADAVWRFHFPAGVAHAFLNNGNAPMVLVSFNTEQHDPHAPDTVRTVLIE